MGSKVWGRVVYFLMLSLNVLGQDSASVTQWKRFSVEPAFSYSYSGYSFSSSFLYRFCKNEFYIGPKIDLSYFNLKSSSPIGIVTGYRYNLPVRPKLNFMLSMDYQNLFIKPLYISETGKGHLNYIQELYLCYGWQLRMLPNLRLGNQMGFGGYHEHFYDQYEDIPLELKDAFAFFKLFLGYDF